MGKSVSFAACPRCVVWVPSWFSGTACLQPTSSVWRGEARSGSWLAVSPETSLNVTLLCEERILSHGETWNSGGCHHPGFPWTSAFPPPCCPLDEGKPWAPVPSRVRGAQASGPGLPRPRPAPPSHAGAALDSLGVFRYPDFRVTLLGGRRCYAAALQRRRRPRSEDRPVGREGTISPTPVPLEPHVPISWPLVLCLSPAPTSPCTPPSQLSSHPRGNPIPALPSRVPEMVALW